MRILKGRHTVFTLVITALMSVISTATAQENSVPTLISAKPVQDILAMDGMVRYVALSPDGNRIAWLDTSGNQLCLMTLAGAETKCHPFAENLAYLGRYSSLNWSPDSKYIATDESFFDQLVDSDIWIFDTSTNEFVNKTDDSYYGGFLQMPDTAMIDYLPTWNPATNDLYFFRTPYQSDSRAELQIDFHQLPLETGEPQLVENFRPQLPVLSVYRPSVISPDGTHIAFLVLPQDFRENPATGVWTYDLSGGALKQVANLADLQSGLPTFADPNKPLMPNFVRWAGNEALVVENRDLEGLGLVVLNSYHVDLNTEMVTALVDFSGVAERVDLFSEPENGEPSIKAVSPMAGIVLPDGSGYIYIGTSPGNGEGYLWWKALPPTDDPPTLISRIPDFAITPAADSTPSISADGQRALLLGYLIELGQ